MAKYLLIGLLIFWSSSCGPMKRANYLWFTMWVLSNGSKGSSTATVEAPIFSPSEGSYSRDQSVEITTKTKHATIYYTIGDELPDANSTEYEGPIAISGDGATLQINAIATRSGMRNSKVASASFTIDSSRVSTPQFSPKGGDYTTDQSVKITTDTAGSSIYYTTDESTPTTESAKYANTPIPVSEGTTTIRAIAVNEGMNDSTVSEARYSIAYEDPDTTQAAAPTFSPAGGSFSSDQSVSLATTTPGADIYYTIDGITIPTTGSTKYTTAIAVNAGNSPLTIQAIVVAEGYDDSEVTEATYTIDYDRVSDVQFNPPPRDYNSDQSITLTCDTYGSTIYYTTDGTEPAIGVTGTTLQYDTPIELIGEETYTIKAIGVAPGYENGNRVSGVYTIDYSLPVTPTISPAAGTYTRVKSVGITSNPGTTLYYTTDGSDPDCSGSDSLYSHVLTVNSTTTVRAIACKSGATPSPVSSSTFTIQTPVAPTFSVDGGSYPDAQLVEISTESAVEFLFYTTDGSSPACDGTNGKIYIQPVAIKENATLQAIACGGGSLNSSIKTETYSIATPPSPFQMGGALQGNTLDLFTTVTTLAGKTYSSDGFGPTAGFYTPSGVTTDGTYLYVADTLNHTIRKIEIATGTVTTLAGSTENAGSNDGTGKDARFDSPDGITTNGTFLFVTDTNNHTIRQIEIATGEVATLAGNPGISGSADGSGSDARFYYPTGIATDGNYLYVADRSNHTIRQIEIATGTVSTLAGNPEGSGSADGTGANARFDYPTEITTDGTYLYAADSWNNTIRKIQISTGEVTTLAGSPGTSGSNDGTGSDARFITPIGITTDGTHLYVTEYSSNTIRKIQISTGEVTTLAGSPGTSGSNDGTGSDARFHAPRGIATDGTYLFVADTGNHLIRSIEISMATVITLAGNAGDSGSTDGTGRNARFRTSSGITTDGTHLYVVDKYNHTIRKIEISTGAVTTLAGNPGTSGSNDGTGTDARFKSPSEITTDGTFLFVTDSENHTIRKIEISTGAVTTLAGNAGDSGSTDGTGTNARFRTPSGITTDGTHLYVVDKYNHTIRKIEISTGAVTTLAGSPGVSGSTDGTGSNARFDYPDKITTDGGRLYLGDTGNVTIREIIISTGEVTTLAGQTGNPGSSDGTGTDARFGAYSGITTDGTFLYIADTNNQTIRQIEISTRVVTTLSGSPGSSGSSDGTGSDARFYNPSGITTDGVNLYVTDTNNNSIRKIE